MPHVTIDEDRIEASRISGGRGDMLLRIARSPGPFEEGRDLPVRHLEGRTNDAADAIVRAVVTDLFRREQRLGRPTAIDYAAEAEDEALRRLAEAVANDIRAAI